MDVDDLQVPLRGFEDVTPIPQDDSADPVVSIAYRHNYTVATDYLRAFQASGETSERSLAITRLVLEYNASHYTAWWFRRRCLFALGMDLANELEVAEDIAGDNPKNYQVWYHRRALAEHRGDPGDELAYVDQVVEEDPKNYHAWSHRQWLLQEFRMLDTQEGRNLELSAVDALLQQDLRNNSAWNHRWFVMHSALGTKGSLSDEAVKSELAYALGYAKTAPSNESPWNYLRAFFRTGGRAYKDFPEVKGAALALQKTEAGAKSPHVFSLLAEVYEKEGTEDSLKKAIAAFQHLRDTLDEVRARYWESRLRAAATRRRQLGGAGGSVATPAAAAAVETASEGAAL
ncbi:farnesyltransferase, CAAX box, alpha [Ectocarpus siliculosus]|uniref:Protein farnesyltransferase/geranylgeranyltransferase type-1 subunit alpha n=1 Tax=Ectocarpus siliculosus TaxID=2880 RepID=D8LJX2_ECTSI|nr:farnesyltransferase, CAAX box, alpha [Ectocarpus siliculosus]|eukprot:CBN76023.1 farnesyltransferase, CAAX box, alpha [Ectocarpus siliculosus]